MRADAGFLLLPRFFTVVYASNLPYQLRQIYRTRSRFTRSVTRTNCQDREEIKYPPKLVAGGGGVAL